MAIKSDVSVIIVNWNTCDCLRSCLTFLFAGDYADRKIEVIVVDNGSTDSSVAMVEDQFPLVMVVKNEANMGYARAVNVGLKTASGKYVLLLNSDAYVGRNTIRDLCSFLDENRSVGAVSPRLVREDGRVQPFLFGRDPRFTYLLARGVARFLFDRSLHRWETGKTKEVDWVSGACLMTRKAVFDSIGSLDETMFMFFEDNDLCLRMRMSGWKVMYFPHTTVTHVGGKSAEKNPQAGGAYYDSLELFYHKHYGCLPALFIRFLLIPYRIVTGR